MMKKHTIASWVAALLLGASTIQAQTSAPFLPTAADDRCKQWVDSVMAELSVPEKVGQLLVATVPAKADKQTQKKVRELVKKYKIGGILFSEGTAEGQATITNLANKTAKVPLMITFDGEWGLSMRLENVPDYPRNAALGCIQDDGLVEAYGWEVARQFRELGVHVNFAPDADVNTNPLNPVIHVRSFGEHPKLVAEKMLAYSRGLEAGGVLSVSKHFPGHGDTDKDSHKELPAVYYDRARLDSVELLPFKEAIQAGLGGIMVGHLRVPALEPDGITATSLSRTVVTGLLKEELGFKGLVFTDALDMKGVSKVPQVTTKAVLAGNDMILVQYNTPGASVELQQAVRTGELSEAELDEKCRKVLTYKYLLGIRTPKPQLQVEGMTQRINTDEGQALASQLRKAAVTVINNYFDILPLKSMSGKWAVLSIGKTSESDAPFIEEMKKNLDFDRYTLTWGADSLTQVAAAEKLKDYSRVLISMAESPKRLADTDARFLARLDLQAPVIYACFTPYRILQTAEAAMVKSSAVVLAHSAEADLQQHVARLLVGKESANGRLSMSIGETFPVGTGCDITPGMEQGDYIPEDYGMKSYVLQRIDAIAAKGVAAGAYPGCRILVLKDGNRVYDKGFGTHSPTDRTPVRSTDMFDLAAVTQPSGTLLAVMKLYEEGKLKLTDKVSKFVPQLRAGNKRDLTIRELLMHESGLPPHVRFYLETIDPRSVKGPYLQSWVDENHQTRVSQHSYYVSNFTFKRGLMSDKMTKQHTLHMADGMWLNKTFKNTILQEINKCELMGKRYVYSDLGFVLLQQVVEAVTKLPLDLYLTKEFYAPMGLQRTLFLPLRRYPKSEIMPTAENDFLRRQNIHGYVHDETAACLGGVSGNAGLFSTAEELGKIYQMLLNGGEWDGKRYLKEATCRLFIGEKSAISRRGLGFDKADPSNPKGNPCGQLAPIETFGQTGFTGTCVWADPVNKLVYVFLANRLCPEVWSTKIGDMHIRTDIQDLIYESLKK